jgi:diguanylate cyclase (GGDEF)-like protein
VGISVRACLILIQLILLVALAAVGTAAWFAIDNSNGFARDLALVSRAQRYQQQGETMQDAVRADVNAALLVAQDAPDTAEVVLASARENARQYTAALDDLKGLRLPQALEQRVTQTRPAADAYIARATAITAIAVRNHERGSALRPKFVEGFEALRRVNRANSELFTRETEQAELAASQAAASAQTWIIAAVITTAAITCAFVGLIGLTMRRSLRRLRDVARALADGNLAVRSTYRAGDEVGELSAAINKMADDLQRLIDRLRAEAERDAFGTQLVEALEMSDAEGEVHRVVALAMSQIATDLPMELLLSDSSRAHLERAAEHPKAGAPGCAVESPFNCVAVRRGNPVIFEDSEALNACPRLRARACGAVSAVCVPVSFMGRSLGVLHATGAVHQVPTTEQISQLTTLGIQAGARIGTVRAFERTQIQASTDSLTGLTNRRTLEEAARALATGGTHYTFVLADLDYFKRLNDGHGHEAGDKALRLFSEVLKKAVRAGDLVGRWGGEEFAVLFPKCTAAQAVEVVQRMRASLAEALVISGSPPFTASYGVADSSMATPFEAVVRIADCALYESKDGGRDRATIGDAARAAGRHESEQVAAIDLRMLANNV